MNQIELYRIEHLFRLAVVGKFHISPYISPENKNDIDETLSYFQKIFNEVANPTPEPAGRTVVIDMDKP
jgi:hypothetical protein